MLAISLMMAALFRLRSRDSAFGWFAIALLCWAIHIAMPLIPRLPFDDPYTRTNLSQISLGAYIIVAAFFVHRFVGIKYARREKWFALWFLVGVVAVMMTPMLPGYPLRWFMGAIWYPPVACVGMYVTWPLWQAYKKSSVLGAGLLTAVSWFLFVVGASDQGVGIGLMQWRPSYHPYTASLVLIAFGYILLRRFVYAVEIAEHARDELEVRVVEKTMALERNLVRIKDMEREQALNVERERIMRDMHDGVGGQLVQALSMATGRSELRPLEGPLRSCLEELRLIIDSIEPAEGDLGSVLGTLRTRMSHRLTAAGIELHWQVEDIPLLADFGPRRVLQLTRIVQEAITNVIKHARATRITIGACAANEKVGTEIQSLVIVQISDNGVGFTPAKTGGVGLENMRCRARDLQAQLAIDSSQAGTTVRIFLSCLATESGNETIGVLNHSAE
jgi:signal transduction histidine kinase